MIQQCQSDVTFNDGRHVVQVNLCIVLLHVAVAVMLVQMKTDVSLHALRYDTTDNQHPISYFHCRSEKETTCRSYLGGNARRQQVDPIRRESLKRRQSRGDVGVNTYIKWQGNDKDHRQLSPVDSSRWKGLGNIFVCVKMENNVFSPLVTKRINRQ